MNTMLNAMKENANVIKTENGGVAYASTMDGLQDLFALGGAYRKRTEDDVILLFKEAFEENETYALKCLFYLRDIRGGQGERRFFRTVVKWLAMEHPEVMERNMIHIPEFGRWDDLYAFVGTPLETEAFRIMYSQLNLDVKCKTPSLLAKWLKSANTSSPKSRELGVKTQIAFGMTPKQYRKTLTVLRERIRVVEKLMSENRWDEIEFDKIPSRAGLIYRNAFARRDIIKEKFESFAKDKDTKVNAATLTPADVVSKVINKNPYRWENSIPMDDVDRLMLNKYWENLTDFFNEATFDGIAVVDTSGSMTCGYSVNGIRPIDVSIALGMYCAENCGKDSPWANHYITFSREAELVEVKGVDFFDKVCRIYQKCINENTNIQSVFDLLLNTAKQKNVNPEDMPKNVVIISDMEFDHCQYNWRNEDVNSELETIAKRWKSEGYEMPKLVFWNVDARQDNIPMRDNGRVTFVSGYSPVIFEMVLTGKTGLDLVMDKLNSDRYACIK